MDLIDRRRMLTMAGTAGLGALLAACGQDSASTASATSTSTSTSAPTSTSTSTSTTVGSAPGAAASIGAADFTSGACQLTPAQTEGPYYLNIDEVRRDITEGRPGAPLTLALRVQDLGAGCAAVPGAAVDVWHADATGAYSGVSGASGTFLRGTQMTDAAGIVEFATVYPGWYQGRTVHIHAKVHLSSTTELTTQLYFDDALTDAVYGAAPYSSRPNRSTRNADDGIAHGGPMLTMVKRGSGWLGTITLGVRR